MKLFGSSNPPTPSRDVASGQPSVASTAVFKISWTSVRDLLKPSLYAWEQRLERGAELDLAIDYTSDALIVKYHMPAYGDHVRKLFDRSDIDSGAYKSKYKSSMVRFINEAREQYAVRVFRNTDVSSPTLRERHVAIATQHRRKGKRRRLSTPPPLPSVRIPRLINLCHLDRISL